MRIEGRLEQLKKGGGRGDEDTSME